LFVFNDDIEILFEVGFCAELCPETIPPVGMIAVEDDWDVEAHGLQCSDTDDAHFVEVLSQLCA
jgi:hypothetical protein